MIRLKTNLRLLKTNLKLNKQKKIMNNKIIIKRAKQMSHKNYHNNNKM